MTNAINTVNYIKTQPVKAWIFSPKSCEVMDSDYTAALFHRVLMAVMWEGAAHGL